MPYNEFKLTRTTPSQLKGIQESYYYESDSETLDEILAVGYFDGFPCSDDCETIVTVNASDGWANVHPNGDGGASETVNVLIGGALSSDVSNIAKNKFSFAASLPNRPIVFGALGDSITQNNYANNFSAGMGTEKGWVGRSWILRACAKMGRKAWANIYAAEGYSGRRTDQIYTEMKDATNTLNVGPSDATAIPDGVLATSPDMVFEMSGTNDLLADLSLGYMLQGRRMIWTRLIQNGIIPVVLSLLPREDDSARAAMVPAWNLAIKQEAERMGLVYIDIYTPCVNETGGWKTGYDFVNDAKDPTGLHPGAEACEAIAQAISDTLNPILGARLGTPTIIDNTNNAVSAPYDSDLLGDEYDLFDTGLFPSTAGWPIRFETSMVTSRLVEIGGVAEYGNQLKVTVDSYAGTSGGFTDTTGPSKSVVAGEKYGFFARVKFTAKAPEEAFGIGLQGGNAAGEMLFSIKGGAANGAAATASGASLNEMDVYQEVTIPTGVTSVRPYFSAAQDSGVSTSGATIEISQIGMVKIN
jgi:lysophospholipase L1-like esterase